MEAKEYQFNFPSSTGANNLCSQEAKTQRIERNMNLVQVVSLAADNIAKKTYSIQFGCMFKLN